MADRSQHRGGRGGGRGGENRGGRGGRGNDRGGRGGASAGERPKKENILDLGKYMDKRIVVKFTGGREDDEGNTSSRSLGLVVARGTLLVLVSPVDGSEEIANPFMQTEE
ncbi:U6 snRNA-associated Sm LSm7 [Hyphodiscus hymeniophilus]|uniref:U6 snRNA-associated Sm LSm7 n=1 Tax=Hyphodiscus hymeniophilus TaxID=353542 RepID=A0A9P7AZQ9_9HELO|nr:U6 snRNA-associated Sm LSm7 [Hyphodiscus hymeniophilus]